MLTVFCLFFAAERFYLIVGARDVLFGCGSKERYCDYGDRTENEGGKKLVNIPRAAKNVYVKIYKMC